MRCFRQKSAIGKRATVAQAFARLLRIIVNFWITLALSMNGVPWSHQGVAQAQTFALGYKKYTKGDMKGAAEALQRALPQAKSPAEKAKILKFLGIAQFTLGNKAGAAASFKNALTLQPGLSISADEVLDESVIPFFKSQASATRTAARPAAPASSGKPRYGKPTKSTWAVINSNAKGATIMMDGILAGSVGDKIEVSPGVVKLTLQAPGFHAKTFTVKIHENRENNVTLNLNKIQPRKKAPPVAARTPNAEKGRPSPVKDDMFSESEPKYQDEVPAGRDLKKEFEAESGQGYPAAAPPMGAPAPYPGAAPVYQQPAPVYQAPVVVPSPVYTMPQPYAAPYPGGYPQQPYPGGYQQPYPQSPVPYGNAPTNNPYGAPAVPQAAEPPPPAPDYFADEEEEEDIAPPSTRAAAPRIAKKKKKKDSGSSQNLLVTLLPFGIAQFQSGSPMLGAGLAVGQAAGIFIYFDKNKKADAYTATASSELQRMDEEGTYDDDQKAKFEAEAVSYIQTLRSQGDYGLYLFAGLWAAGVTEAFLNPPSPPKKKRRRADLGLSSGEKIASDDSGALQRQAPEPYDLKLGPIVTPEDQQAPVKFGLILKHRF